MEIGGHVHWYVTSRCNLDCSYCFKPDANYGESTERLGTLAQILVENNVKKVTIGGGEPTLVKDLGNVLRILKKGEIYVSLHTNGTLLGDRRIAQLSGLVDDVALPIDSVHESIQKELGREKFISTFNRIFEIVEAVQKNNIGLGYHTVFTSINYQDIPEIYELIKQTDFGYWRIYEFNSDLAINRVFEAGKSIKNGPEQRKLVDRIEKINLLDGNGTPEKGYTDCLFAHFLRMEQQMKQYKDERIQFVGVRDYKPIYAFLDNSGDIGFYTWLPQRERRVLGNIRRDGFPFVKKRLQEAHEKDWEFDDKTGDEFIDATMGRPIWARLEVGDYCFEEIEEIDERFLGDVECLAELYTRREKTL